VKLEGNTVITVPGEQIEERRRAVEEKRKAKRAEAQGEARTEPKKERRP